MKRSHRPRKFNPRKLDLSTDQFAGIGKVAIAYNYAETSIDRCLAVALDLPAGMEMQVTSRINGIDGKIELIKKTATALSLPSELRLQVADTLGKTGFSLLKSYRDGVIHARVLDADLGIGEHVGRRAQHIDVLLKADALDALADHLRAISIEITSLIFVFLTAQKLAAAAPDDPKTAQLLEDIQDDISLYREYQSHRLSLPPLPEFPEEPEDSEALEWSSIPAG